MENLPARTLTASATHGWFASAATFIGGLWSAIQAVRGALHKEPVRKRARASRTSEARRVRPERPSWLDNGELPASYGRTKVVAMAVSPYLVHVYWDLAKDQAAQRGPASLRFHDATTGGRFDVSVDLTARSWYVHLWSPDKQYIVELGLQRGSSFVPLAQSNQVETPRAWPVSEISEQFTQPAKPNPVGPDHRTRLTPLMAPASTAQPEPQPLKSAQIAFRLTSVPEPEPARPPAAAPSSAIEVLRRRLSELYASRRWPARRAVAAPSALSEFLPDMGEQQLAHPGPLDLTGRAESQFSPGLSSTLAGAPPR